MATEDNCNADGLANELFTSLTVDAPTPPTVDLTGVDFTFVKDTTSGLYDPITPIKLEDLTTGSLDGEGVFDKMMAVIDVHINREYKGSRITGAQYAEVYTAVTNQVMGQATSFVLQKDQAKWAAITAQMQARVAEIQATEALIGLEKTKAETMKMIFDMKNSGAQYALTKMEIANADAKHCQIKAETEGTEFNTHHLMPAELGIKQYERNAIMPGTVAMNKVQYDRILPAEAAIKEYQNREMQPIERDLQLYQLEVAGPAKTGMDVYTLEKVMPVQLGKEQHLLNFQMPAQTRVIQEQAEVQRAQTMETRSDGLTLVKGLLGKQKDSVTKDIEVKTYTINEKMPVELDLIKEQREVQRAQTLDTRTDGATVVGIVGKQKESTSQDIAGKVYTLQSMMPMQLEMLKEQREAERAKTLDTRTDNQAVKGSVGKQKDLYTQQIDSFVKDSQYKVAKMYLDTWITQKTLDEGLNVPDALTNTNISTIIASVRTKNAL